MEKFNVLSNRIIRPATLVACLAIIAYVLFFQRLGSLLPGYSAQEIATFHAASDWHKLLTDPINAPYTLPLWLLTAVFHQGILMTRVISVAFGMLVVIAFFGITRLRYNHWLSLLVTIVFASSSGLLLTARYGTPQILHMSVVILIGALLWYHSTHMHKILAGYGIVALLAILLYVPGMIWFELLGIIVLHRSIKRVFIHIPTKHLVFWLAPFIALLTPLIYATTLRPTFILDVLGLPHSMDQLAGIGLNLWHVLLSIGLRSSGDATQWLAYLPLLSFTGVILLLIGIYHSIYLRRNFRTVFVGLSALVAFLLCALQGGNSLSYLIPLLYLFIGEGIEGLIGSWLHIFPRNPIARVTGVVLVCAVLSLSILYQTKLYFVAWPHNTETRQSFRHHLG